MLHWFSQKDKLRMYKLFLIFLLTYSCATTTPLLSEESIKQVSEEVKQTVEESSCSPSEKKRIKRNVDILESEHRNKSERIKQLEGTIKTKDEEIYSLKDELKSCSEAKGESQGIKSVAKFIFGIIACVILVGLLYIGIQITRKRFGI
jgi:vacuolar-type H+-ATPase subunit I/STV1